MDIGQLRGLLLDLDCMTALRHTLRNRAMAALVDLCRACAKDNADEAALTAAHCGMPLLCLSVMTNMAAGVLDQPLSGEEVDETAAAVADRFSAYLTRIVREMEVASL